MYLPDGYVDAYPASWRDLKPGDAWRPKIDRIGSALIYIGDTPEAAAEAQKVYSPDHFYSAWEGFTASSVKAKREHIYILVKPGFIDEGF